VIIASAFLADVKLAVTSSPSSRTIRRRSDFLVLHSD
jgi:hypothetical protein